jgi:hypothetical protein
VAAVVVVVVAVSDGKRAERGHTLPVVTWLALLVEPWHTVWEWAVGVAAEDSGLHAVTVASSCGPMLSIHEGESKSAAMDDSGLHSRAAPPPPWKASAWGDRQRAFLGVEVG